MDMGLLRLLRLLRHFGKNKNKNDNPQKIVIGTVLLLTISDSALLYLINH